MRVFLNVGGSNKTVAVSPELAGWQHVLLDIDERGQPDIVCDARELTALAAGQYDAVYCSHNLEHYHRHEVPRVLAGFRHVLKPGGFVDITVPDIQAVIEQVVQRGLDIDDELYQSRAGPITVQDVIYGYGPEIAESGNDFYAHKTGFSPKSLRETLQRAGFNHIYLGTGSLEIRAIALVNEPDAFVRGLFGLS